MSQSQFAALLAELRRLDAKLGSTLAKDYKSAETHPAEQAACLPTLRDDIAQLTAQLRRLERAQEVGK